MDIDALDALYADLLRGLGSESLTAAEAESRIAGILAMEEGREGDPLPWASDLATAMTLLPIGTWFLWNHFGFQVVLNRPVAGGPWSNAMDYHPEGASNEGAPVSYQSMAFDSQESRGALPLHVCAATFMARRAPILKERARRDGRPHVVQTGHGPLLAMPDGKLREIPHGRYFTADGRLVPHDEAIHGGARLEAPDA